MGKSDDWYKPTCGSQDGGQRKFEMPYALINLDSPECSCWSDPDNGRKADPLRIEGWNACKDYGFTTSFQTELMMDTPLYEYLPFRQPVLPETCKNELRSEIEECLPFLSNSPARDNKLKCPGQTSWHPGWRKHRAIGMHVAWFMLEGLQKAIDMYTDKVNRDGGTDSLSTWDYALARDYVAPPAPGPCCESCSEGFSYDPCMCDELERFQCATAFEPKVKPGIEKIIVSAREAIIDLDDKQEEHKTQERLCSQHMTDKKRSLTLMPGTRDQRFGVLLRLENFSRIGGKIVMCETPMGWRKPDDMGDIFNSSHIIWHVGPNPVFQKGGDDAFKRIELVENEKAPCGTFVETAADVPMSEEGTLYLHGQIVGDKIIRIGQILWTKEEARQISPIL